MTQHATAMQPLPRNTVIQGRVMNTRALRGIYKATVKVKKISSSQTFIATTNSYGYYKISAQISSGTYTVQALASGFTAKSTSISITSGRSYKINFSLNPLPPADTTPPTGSIAIQNAGLFISGNRVTLNLSAADRQSGMGAGSQMRFSNNNTTWSTPEPYAARKEWTLAADFDFQKAYVKFKDAAGNWSKSYSASAFVSNPAKVQGISVYYPDINLDNRLDAVDVQLVLNAVLGISIGSYNADVNRDGKLDAVDVQLIINAVLGIDITPPAITALTPTDGTRLTENTVATIRPTIYDVDPSPVEYQFSIDNVVKQAWTTSATYAWTTTVGVHTIKVEVRDTGGANSKSNEVFVIRNPIQPPAAK